MSGYVIDANTFIEAKNRAYGFDFHPAYWDWLDGALGGPDVYCITNVLNEMASGNDPLAAWVTARKGSFVSPTAGAISHLQRVTAQVQSYASKQAAARVDFLSGADPWLIAHALETGRTVVTHEVREPRRKNKVKIPDVCDDLGVGCIDPFTMFRQLGVTFDSWSV